MRTRLLSGVAWRFRTSAAGLVRDEDSAYRSGDLVGMHFKCPSTWVAKQEADAAQFSPSLRLGRAGMDRLPGDRAQHQALEAIPAGD